MSQTVTALLLRASSLSIFSSQPRRAAQLPRPQFYAEQGLRLVCPTSAAIGSLVGAVRAVEEAAV
jgi:hypothetical protein